MAGLVPALNLAILFRMFTRELSNLFAISVLWLRNRLARLRSLYHRSLLHSAGCEPDKISRDLKRWSRRLRRRHHSRTYLRTNSRDSVFLDADRLQLRNTWRDSASLLPATKN